MKTHNLKIMVDRYLDIKSGKKTFEIRFNDRDYFVYDTLILTPVDILGLPLQTLVPLECKIVYTDNYEQKENYLVLGIELNAECEWKYQDGRFDWDSYFDTGCDNSFMFMDGQTRADNEDFKFCPYCGKKIKEIN